MPKWLHNKLKRQAKKKGLSGEDYDRYVYGALTNWEKRQRGEPVTKKRRIATP